MTICERWLLRVASRLGTRLLRWAGKASPQMQFRVRDLLVTWEWESREWFRCAEIARLIDDDTPESLDKADKLLTELRPIWHMDTEYKVLQWELDMARRGLNK